MVSVHMWALVEKISPEQTQRIHDAVIVQSLRAALSRLEKRAAIRTSGVDKLHYRDRVDFFRNVKCNGGCWRARVATIISADWIGREGFVGCVRKRVGFPYWYEVP